MTGIDLGALGDATPITVKLGDLRFALAFMAGAPDAPARIREAETWLAERKLTVPAAAIADFGLTADDLNDAADLLYEVDDARRSDFEWTHGAQTRFGQIRSRLRGMADALAAEVPS